MNKTEVKKGRKPKGAEKRSKKVTAAFTEKEFELLLQKATKANTSVSELVHSFTLKGRVVEPESREERNNKIAAIREINNINQVAKNLNYLSKNFRVTAASKLLDDTQVILTKLYKILDE